MSIVTAIIHPSGGVVASDGRVFGSVQAPDGVAISPAPIASEAFDKTFSAMDGHLIGGFSGLMEFSGKRTSTHLTEIITDLSAQFTELEQAADLISVALRDRLLQVAPADVKLSLTNLAVLFVGKRRLTKDNRQIVARIFDFAGDQVAFSPGKTQTTIGNLNWAMIGDDQASAAINNLLAHAPRGRSGGRFLLETARLAIARGIAASNTYKYGNERNCGGTTFTQSLL